MVGFEDVVYHLDLYDHLNRNLVVCLTFVSPVGLLQMLLHSLMEADKFKSENAAYEGDFKR